MTQRSPYRFTLMPTGIENRFPDSPYSSSCGFKSPALIFPVIENSETESSSGNRKYRETHTKWKPKNSISQSERNLKYFLENYIYLTRFTKKQNVGISVPVSCFSTSQGFNR